MKRHERAITLPAATATRAPVDSICRDRHATDGNRFGNPASGVCGFRRARGHLGIVHLHNGQSVSQTDPSLTANECPDGCPNGHAGENPADDAHRFHPVAFGGDPDGHRRHPIAQETKKRLEMVKCLRVFIARSKICEPHDDRYDPDPRHAGDEPGHPENVPRTQLRFRHHGGLHDRRSDRRSARLMRLSGDHPDPSEPAQNERMVCQSDKIAASPFTFIP